MFQKPVRFICMFRGSLNGLKIGAPVKVRGVQIGSVFEIRLRLAPSEGRLRPDAGALRLPVIIELDRSQIIGRGATGEALEKRGFEEMVTHGMRAQLNVESLLTGLLYIDLDLHPGAPIDLAIEPGSGPYLEIPTIPTNLEAIQEQATKALAKLDQIDFQAMVASITDAANSIKGLTNSPELKTTLESLQGDHRASRQSGPVDSCDGRQRKREDRSARDEPAEELRRGQRHDETDPRSAGRSSVYTRSRLTARSALEPGA